MAEILRFSVPGDEGQLKSLWEDVFRDEPEYIDRFFDMLYAPGMAALCELDGRIVSAAYVLRLGDLVREGRWTPCRVVYSYGTHPDFRRRGFGGKVLRMAYEASVQTGYGVICPSESELFDYYEGFGYSKCFAVSEQDCTDVGLPLTGSVTRVTVRGYAALREELLHGRTHIDFDIKPLEFQEAVCNASGGGLFYIVTEGDRCCAAVEIRDGRAFIPELIAPSASRYNAAALAARCVKCQNFTYRTPPRPGDEAAPFAMLSAPAVPGETLPGWFGFAFD